MRMGIRWCISWLSLNPGPDALTRVAAQIKFTVESGFKRLANVFHFRALGEKWACAVGSRYCHPRWALSCHSCVSVGSICATYTHRVFENMERNLCNNMDVNE